MGSPKIEMHRIGSRVARHAADFMDDVKFANKGTRYSSCALPGNGLSRYLPRQLRPCRISERIADSSKSARNW